MQEQVQALETLARLDEAIGGLQEELEAERAALGGKRDQVNQLEAKLASIKASMDEMDRTRGELIGEARQMSAQMERSREKLGRSRTEREVNAAQREVEELRKLFRDREIETQKLAGLIEQAEAEAQQTESELKALAAELGSSEGEVETRLQQLEKESGHQLQEREAAAKSVPQRLYRRYEMIRKRRGTAICFAGRSGTCSECHILLPPMMFQQLRRATDFSQCPSCNRILYYREDSPDSSKSESTEEEPAAG
jgi:predicted  nucleic acid-binding Zn-ribbon protein